MDGPRPTPHDSGEVVRKQGISPAGKARLQALSIQLPWNWVRWQPGGVLTQWFVSRAIETRVADRHLWHWRGNW